MKLMTYDTNHDGHKVTENTVILDNGITPEEVLKKWNANNGDWKYNVVSVYNIKGTITMEDGHQPLRVIYSRHDI